MCKLFPSQCDCLNRDELGRRIERLNPSYFVSNSYVVLQMERMNYKSPVFSLHAMLLTNQRLVVYVERNMEEEDVVSQQVEDNASDPFADSNRII